MAEKLDANVIFFGRDAIHDDAHTLNAIICANASRFSADFVQRWHVCYQAYCTDRTTIEMADESNWS